MNRRGPARRGGQPARTVQSRQRRAQGPQIPEPTRDERGLTPWHYGPGHRQVLCGTCDQNVCADRCPTPWRPDAVDTLHRKASRANLTIEQWAAVHPDWIGWELHKDREDVRDFQKTQRAEPGAQTLDATVAGTVTSLAHAVQQTPRQEKPADIHAAPTTAALAQQEQEAMAVQRCREAGDAFMREVAGERAPETPVQDDPVPSLALEPAGQEVTL